MIDFACKKFELKSVIKCSLGLTKSDILIMTFLIKNDESFFSSQYISKNLMLDLSTVQRSLKKLTEKNIVTRQQKNLYSGGYVFSYRINDKKIIRKQISDIIHGWVKKFDLELEKW
jgi:predicted transcriptional regulator